MKQITNISQLLPEDVGTVIEVLQGRFGGFLAERVWQRGVYLGLTPCGKSENRAISIVIEENEERGRYLESRLYSNSDGSVPDTESLCQGVRLPDPKEMVKKYSHLLEGIEPERKASYGGRKVE
ncbi:MAG: hypothetical protein WCI72_06555 [archaeon]